MRNLNDQITAWRKRMAAGGVQSPVILDELESHLREDVERHVRAGRSEEDAFAAAVRRMGESDLLKAEFAKIGGTKEGRPGKLIAIACCGFAALYSLVLTPGLFFIQELSPVQRTLGLSAVGLTFFSIVSLRFSYKFLPIIRNRRVRTIAVMGCGLAGLAWLLIFANLLPNVIVPRAMHEGASAESIRGSVLIGLQHATNEGFAAIFRIGLSLLWAMTLAAILGGLAYGLEEAAKRRAKENAYV
jgi:hypothetical protein